MRRLLFAVIGIAALSVLVACNSSSTASKKTPASGSTPGKTAASTSAAGTPQGGTPAMSFADACKKSDQKQWSAPDKVIDTSKTYVATIKTVKGDIVVELDAKAAPETVNSFVFLSCKGFYDGVTFHRVISGFVAQGGDPTGTGTGGPGYNVPAEFEGSKFDTGVIGLARAQSPSSGGSQFYIMLGRAASLDGQYTAFGKVTKGMDVAQSITPRDPSTNPNAPPGDAITTIEIEEK